MKKVILINAALLLLLSASSFGQNPNKVNPRVGGVTGGLGYFNVGMGVENTAKLNDIFKADGYPQISQYHIKLGGGGHAIIKNVIVGGEGQGFIEREDANSKYMNNIDGGYGLFNLGYVFYAENSFLFYPMIGIGSGSYRVKFGDNPASTQFNNLVVTPQRSVDLQTGGMIIGFQFGAEKFFGGNKDGSYGGSLIGIHIGYNYAPTTWGWKWNTTKITDAPKVNMDGAYVTITIGGGGYVKKQ